VSGVLANPVVRSAIANSVFALRYDPENVFRLNQNIAPAV